MPVRTADCNRVATGLQLHPCCTQTRLLTDSPLKARCAHLSQRSVWDCCNTRQSIWDAATCDLATLPADA